jgi:hypothetical protein
LEAHATNAVQYIYDTIECNFGAKPSPRWSLERESTPSTPLLGANTIMRRRVLKSSISASRPAAVASLLDNYLSYRTNMKGVYRSCPALATSAKTKVHLPLRHCPFNPRSALANQSHDGTEIEGTETVHPCCNLNSAFTMVSRGFVFFDDFVPLGKVDFESPGSPKVDLSR